MLVHVQAAQFCHVALLEHQLRHPLQQQGQVRVLAFGFPTVIILYEFKRQIVLYAVPHQLFAQVVLADSRHLLLIPIYVPVHPSVLVLALPVGERTPD